MEPSHYAAAMAGWYRPASIPELVVQIAGEVIVGTLTGRPLGMPWPWDKPAAPVSAAELEQARAGVAAHAPFQRPSSSEVDQILATAKTMRQGGGSDG